MEKIEYPKWLPDSVKKKCIPIIENEGMLSEYREVLIRLLTDDRMKSVYKVLKNQSDKKVLKNQSDKKVLKNQSDKEDKLGNHILAIMSLVVGVNSYSTFTTGNCKDKLESIADKIQSIADDLMEIKKGKVILPVHLSDPSSFLLKFYQDKHESNPDNLFIEKHKNHLHNLRVIEMSQIRNSGADLINAFQTLSLYFKKESQNNPYILWREEFFGEPPTKLLDNYTEKHPPSILMKKSALVRKLGAYIYSIYETPLYGTVATLSNVGLNLSGHDSVKKDSAKKTLEEYLTNDLKDYLKGGRITT
jgi:hypothetical protein